MCFALELRCVAAATAALALCAPASARQHDTQCGVKLWAKKTLRDSGASTIGWVARITTIAWLLKQHPPADPDVPTHRLSPVETTAWRVRALLVGYKIESDSDYHVILRDPATGGEMIGEIPAPFCVASRAGLYRDLRATVERIGRHPASRTWWWLDRGATPPTVTVDGVGFFDRLHESGFHAPNGVELHPVLAISK